METALASGLEPLANLAREIETQSGSRREALSALQAERRHDGDCAEGVGRSCWQVRQDEPGVIPGEAAGPEGDPGRRDGRNEIPSPSAALRAGDGRTIRSRVGLRIYAVMAGLKPAHPDPGRGSSSPHNAVRSRIAVGR